MSIEWLTIFMTVVLSVLLAAGVPFAVSTGMTAVITALINFGPASLMIVASRIFDISENFALLAVPMFILMGCILERSGVAESLFSSMYRLTEKIPGGLAVGTIFSATVMAAMVGVVGAEVVLLGLVALPAMLRHGYDKGLACGVICAGGSLGTMIPPSLVLVIYGLIANVSISDLFVAAVFPGLLLAALYTVYVVVRCMANPSLAPRSRDLGHSEKPMRPPPTIRERLILFVPIGIIGLVMGTLYAGIATPSEAASLGVLGAVLAAALNRALSAKALWGATQNTARALGPVIWTFFGANAMVNVYALAGGIDYIKTAFVSANMDPIFMIIAIQIFLFILGLALDWIGIAVLTMPVFVPIITALGYDPIWFGILFCMNMQMSYLTPPFGGANFYLKGVAPPEISMTDINRSVWPYVGLQAIAVALVIWFPQISLWPLQLLK
jgi:tripartite ATP-independent transporter DctM subunit